MKLPAWMPPAVLVAGVLAFAFGVIDLEFGHRLSGTEAEGYIRSGLELIGGVGAIGLGAKTTGAGGGPAAR